MRSKAGHTKALTKKEEGLENTFTHLFRHLVSPKVDPDAADRGPRGLRRQVRAVAWRALRLGTVPGEYSSLL